MKHQYKTYLTTEQFIKVWESLDEPKQKELHAAWYAARYVAWDAGWDAARSAAWHAAWNAARYAARNADWNAARDANLAILVKDKISDEFNLLTSPWTSCGLSLFVEDWEQVLNPKAGQVPKRYDETYPAGMNGNRSYVEDNFGDTNCPCFGCQCEPNQVTKDAIEEARNQNDPR